MLLCKLFTTTLHPIALYFMRSVAKIKYKGGDNLSLVAEVRTSNRAIRIPLTLSLRSWLRSHSLCLRDPSSRTSLRSAAQSCAGERGERAHSGEAVRKRVRNNRTNGPRDALDLLRKTSHGLKK